MPYDSSKFKIYYLVIMAFFYLGQGYSLGSMVLLLPLYIKNEFVMSYAKATAISTTIVSPWYVKFIFGMITDNYPIRNFGRRKPFLIIATAFSAYGWLTIGIHSAATLGFFISGFALATGSALADTVIDGQIVEITPDEYAGRTQGVAWGARGFGIGMAASLSPWLVDHISWQSMFSLASVFGISISIIVLILPQIEYTQSGRTLKIIIGELRELLVEDQQYNFADRMQFMVLTGSSLAIVPILPIIMEKEFLFDYSTIGLGSLFFAIGSLIGAVLNGFIFDTHDTRRSFSFLSSLFSLILLFGLVFIVSDSRVLQMSFLIIIGLITGAYEAYQLKTIQESSSKDHEGTIFSIYTSLSNLGQFLAGGYLLVSLAELMQVSLFIPILLCILSLFLAIKPISDFKFSKKV
ncbi:MAG: MFS transporter [Candidatus Heimdallarchaeota archaeon]|nr:MFS transporter [Candidatus Heimdallarchaeota archaeon]